MRAMTAFFADAFSFFFSSSSLSSPFLRGMPLPITRSRLSPGMNSAADSFICFCARCGRISEMQKTGSPSSSPILMSTTEPSFLHTTP